MSGPFNQYAKEQRNSATQPKLRFWNHMGQFGSGTMDLDPGDYNLHHDASRSIRSNDIDAIYVPYNYVIKANSNGNDASRGANATFDGEKSNTGEPGMFWNFSGDEFGIGINDIDVMNIRQKEDIDETDPDGTKKVPYTWNRFKQKCCANALSADKCGIHRVGVSGSDCDQVFRSCTGMDLKVPYGSNPSYRSQYCAAMASANTTVGDTIKRQFCISNPADPFCSCMNLTNKPEYIRWAQAMNAKHPEIVISPLMYMDVNGYNPCRTHLTTDMQTQFIPSELIAQIGHLPTSYSIADLTVSGDNNILTDINISGKPVTPPSRPSSNSSSDNKDATAVETAYTNYMIIAFVIIVAAVCAYSFIDDEPQPQYYYANTQRPMMQPMMQQYQQPYQTIR